ncbi:hypothetical protein [Leisingera methylohalidivorans]|uniref:Uncharacterized protein n=1 Tax=Leisingera methylohalidivorans DSM 14336 TaxID=999552 RepID=V9VZG7_9RHOB|nr:hypothetical protein [Leisingera methylohalidivorans]AHD02272.1 hypothetical protein METH_18120 [Leisingera methylohalidivorans DSM 14336]
MAESLLSFSEVLLFGRLLNDLQIVRSDIKKTVRVATVEKVNLNNVDTELDGVELAEGDLVLVRRNNANENGVYKVTAGAGSAFKLAVEKKISADDRVAVLDGIEHGDTVWTQTKDIPKQNYKQAGLRGRGRNNLLDAQLSLHAKFARIYGFAYEGTYHELPEPALFLVHGEGKSATDNMPANQGARAPQNPSITGVASAEYQIANDIRVWDYDKADYSIRMDVMTGMLEQVLLDVYFGGGGPSVSGAKVSGAKVSGAKVSGAKVSGAKARGSGD